MTKAKHDADNVHGSSVVIPHPNRRGSYIIEDHHRRQVLIMRANGNSIETIALVMDISVVSLRRHFKKELATGFQQVSSQIGAILVEQALAGNMSAIKFWLASRCEEWRAARENQLIEPPERDDVVHFYLPPNHRDEPEELPDIVIDGTAEEAA
jgi:hypothetical protein